MSPCAASDKSGNSKREGINESDELFVGGSCGPRWGVALQKYVLDSPVVTDQKEAGEGPTAKKPLYWVAPMDKITARTNREKSDGHGFDSGL